MPIAYCLTRRSPRVNGLDPSGFHDLMGPEFAPNARSGILRQEKKSSATFAFETR